jgi:hypothetical protein
MPADGSFVFRGFVSPNGNNWKQIRMETHMPIGAHALAGMAVTPDLNSALEKVE